MSIATINPATGETIRVYAEHAAGEVENALRSSVAAFEAWQNAPFPQRAQLLREAARLLRDRCDQYAQLMTLEMGKPVAQGKTEVEKCAWTCDYYAENAESFLAPEPITTDATRSLVLYQPLGTVLAVMPWNFPFWQVFRAAAPALMAGNAVVLKHASNVPGCALAIEQLFRDAGLPAGLFVALLLSSKRAESLIEHPVIKAVTVTGSTEAGRAIAAKAGACLKKSVLELGGSDPYLILEDADLELAAETCVTARLINGGQSCIAAKRFIVVEPVRGRFEELFVERMRKQPVCLLARSDLRDDLHNQVRRSVEQGATVVVGGQIPEGPGWFYPPTVLTNVTSTMPVFVEETFGPVAAVVSAADEEAAIRLANDSAFGLGAAVFTRDIARGERVAGRLEAGTCFVNAFVRSDPRLPFGGIKLSGYGRELGVFGIREFVNIKSVYLK